MMAQLNDAMFSALRAAGYAGALPDMRRTYLNDLGYDNMLALYVANGFSTGTLSDFALEYWTGTIETTP